MSERIIRNGRVVEDTRQLVTLAPGADPAETAVPAGAVLVPLGVWRARRDELLERARSGELGVWIDAGEDVSLLADDLAALRVIGVHFPRFTDGRGYSTAALLRGRLGYSGELRAFGEVLRDQFNYLTRCGFDVLQPRSGRYDALALEAACASIADFTEPYQHSASHPQPLFRRARRGTPSPSHP